MAAPLSAYRAHGDLIFLSGHVPVDPETGSVPLAFEDQARVTLANLARTLTEAGSEPSKVLSVTAFVAAREDIPTFNTLYTQLFAAPYPARAVLVSGLPNASYRVEIQAIAHH